MAVHNTCRSFRTKHFALFIFSLSLNFFFFSFNTPSIIRSDRVQESRLGALSSFDNKKFERSRRGLVRCSRSLRRIYKDLKNITSLSLSSVFLPFFLSSTFSFSLSLSHSLSALIDFDFSINWFSFWKWPRMNQWISWLQVRRNRDNRFGKNLRIFCFAERMFRFSRWSASIGRSGRLQAIGRMFFLSLKGTEGSRVDSTLVFIRAPAVTQMTVLLEWFHNAAIHLRRVITSND